MHNCTDSTSEEFVNVQFEKWLRNTGIIKIIIYSFINFVFAFYSGGLSISMSFSRKIPQPLLRTPMEKKVIKNKRDGFYKI